MVQPDRPLLDRSRLRGRALRDGVIIGCIAFVLFILSVRYEPFAWISRLVLAAEDAHLDDLLTVAVFLALASVVFIWRRRAELLAVIRERERLEHEVQTLSGLLPICAWCKKVRDDKGYWKQIEQYIMEHTQTEFTHGICPDCAAALTRGEQHNSSTL